MHRFLKRFRWYRWLRVRRAQYRCDERAIAISIRAWYWTRDADLLRGRPGVEALMARNWRLMLRLILIDVPGHRLLGR